MKLLANKHIFSLIGAVIGVLAGLVFNQALVQILDWKTITLINLATIFFVSGVLIHFVILVLLVSLLDVDIYDDIVFVIIFTALVSTLLFFLLMDYFFDIFSDNIFFFSDWLYIILGIIINALAFLVTFLITHPLIPSLIWALFPLIFLPLVSLEHVYAKYSSIATIIIPIPLLSAITGYYSVKALYSSIENWIRERERKKEKFKKEKREIIEELKKLIGDQDEKR